MDLVDHTGRPWKNGRPLDAHGRTQHSNPDRWDRELLRGDMGRIAVPTVLTFSAILGSAWKAYWHGRQDEAYRNSRPDALAMRRDVHLMGLLQERILSVTSLKWHIEGHDEKNPREVALRNLVEKSIRKIPDWRKFLWSQQLAVWYGKYACQLRPRWREIDGQKALTFDHWAPVNGDKIGHRWDGTPYVLVNAAWADRLPSAETFPTTLGRGLLLEGRWRNRFVIHSHEIEDGDFFDPESAAAVHGLGLRHRIYWYWWVKQEAHEWIFTYLQRVGLGITLWMYDASNPDAKSRAEEAAAEADRRTNLLVPTWPDARGGAPVGGVERIETPVTGVEALRTILDKFDEVMERYVVGQSMSGGSDNKDGLGGTGRANFARDTKAAITEHDAYCLGETLTGSEERPGLVWLIQSQSATDPGLRAVPLRLVFDVESPESKDRLDAAKMIFDMGVSLLASEVRAAAGFSKPNEDDEVVQKPDENAGQQPIQEQRDDPQLAAQALQQEIEADRQRHDAELAQKQAQHEQALRHEEEKHKHAMEREQARTQFDHQQAQAKAALAQQQAQQKAQWQQQAWQVRQQQQQQAWQQKQQQAAQQPAQPAQQTQQAQPTDPYTTSYARESLLERLHSLDGSEASLHALADEILALPDAVVAEAFVRGEAPSRPETEGQQVVRYLREAGEWGLAEVLQYGWVEGKNPPRNRPAGYKHWYGTPPDSGKRTQKTMPRSGGGKKKVDEVVASVRKDLEAGKLSEDTLNDLRSLSGPQLSTLRHYLGLGDRQRKGEKKEEFRGRLEDKLKNPPSPIDNEKEQGKIPPESHREVTEPTGGDKMKTFAVKGTLKRGGEAIQMSAAQMDKVKAEKLDQIELDGQVYRIKGWGSTFKAGDLLSVYAYVEPAGAVSPEHEADPLIVPDRAARSAARKAEKERAQEEARKIAAEMGLDETWAVSIADLSLQRPVYIQGEGVEIPSHFRTPAARRAEFLRRYEQAENRLRAEGKEPPARKGVSNASDLKPSREPYPIVRKPLGGDPTDPEFYRDVHFNPLAHKGLAQRFKDSGRVARGPARDNQKAGAGSTPPARGTLIWERDGPHLVLSSEKFYQEGRGQVARWATVPVEPTDSEADRKAEEKFLQGRLMAMGLEYGFPGEREAVEARLASLRSSNA